MGWIRTSSTARYISPSNALTVAIAVLTFGQTCRACISITQTNNHKCIERATDADCPICGENMFASHKTVIFMDCGHSIHRTCFNEYMASSYKCPICSKSIVNMEALFTNLANIIREQPMPEEFENVTSTILCNDCSAKCTTKYHFLGLRCQICRSYNTAELERSAMPGERAGGGQASVPGHSIPATPEALAFPQRSIQDRTSGPNSAPGLQTNPPHLQYSLSQGAANPTGPHTQAAPEPYAAMDEDDDEELDFWGGEARSGPESEDEDDYEDDTDAEDSDNEEDDDNEEEDIMLFGHR